jgi:PAS domain S-box-containing protein
MERKEKELVKALCECDNFGRQIINSSREGIIVHGSDLRYKYWNPYMEKMTGLAAVDVLGKHPLEIFPFLRETGVLDSLTRTLAGEIVDNLEFPLKVKKAGKLGWGSHSSAPLKNEHGEIIGVIVNIRDITELRMNGGGG